MTKSAAILGRIRAKADSLRCLASSMLRDDHGAEDVAQEASIMALDRSPDVSIGAALALGSRTCVVAQVQERLVGGPVFGFLDGPAPGARELLAAGARRDQEGAAVGVASGAELLV